MTELEKARKIINEVDKEMARLFVRRMEAVKSVAEYKKIHGMQVFDPAREDELIERNSALVENEELKSYYINFLKSNMEISKKYQHRLLEGMRVAFSGVEGAFAGIAAKKVFPDAVTVPFSDFKAAYDSVINGETDCVILPLENSYNGEVGQVMDLAFFGPLYINGVYDISVVQNLLAVKGTDIGQIKQVISHPQALGQCADFIKKHGFETIEAVNTAVAAKQVAEWNRHDIAAIASDEAAKEYGLIKLESNINMSSNNTTRFAVFTRTAKQPSKEDNQFIMVFTVKNEAGALGKAVSIIGENGFNLKSLKSRPTKELIWSYYFFVEGEGNINSEKGRKMLALLSEKCSKIKVLGSFEKEITL
ncbi:MAG: bifunctional chorismate mutase/prephenate dehydratase [Acutalibacteraceae bacterium]|jgi:chorismate mutase/prephenate dehydratase